MLRVEVQLQLCRGCDRWADAREDEVRSGHSVLVTEASGRPMLQGWGGARLTNQSRPPCVAWEPGRNGERPPMPSHSPYRSCSRLSVLHVTASILIDT